MMFSLQTLVLCSAAYLLILFTCAWATEKGFIPKSLVQHPLVYVLSLGVYASSWAYYGSIGIAYESGYAFLAFYFGLSAAFLLAPVLLSPILRIIKNNQLSSLADLFAFRFRNPIAGILCTLLLLVTVMPLLALQIQAVTDSLHIICLESSPEILAIGFCMLVMLFTILFGSHHITSCDHHQGLIFAIAVESSLKLVVMLILGGVIIFQVFDGFEDVSQWVEVHGNNISDMTAILDGGTWRASLLMFFASATVMPHMFHMTFTENRDASALCSASWGLPLFLLLLSVSTPLIIWAGIKLGIDIPAEYFPLAIGQKLDIPWLTIIVYMAGLSAASGLIIVTTLAVSSVVLNHMVLPWCQYSGKINININIYRRLVWMKRLIIIMLIMSAYGFYHSVNDDMDLYNLSIVAYVGALQLFPGVICTLYWEKLNNKGFISGLLAGASVWFLTLMLPLAMDQDVFLTPSNTLNVSILENWHLAATFSLIVNVLVFYIVSCISKMSDAEIRVAQSCLVRNVKMDIHRAPKAGSAIEFQEILSIPLGRNAAHKEVQCALSELEMKFDEKRPHALARLRDKIETNISGLMGPTVAHEIVGTFLPHDIDKGYITQDLHFMETRLEAYHSELTGLEAELDSLRRYHRETLNSIPLGVCAIGNNDIMLWNFAIAQMTGLNAALVLGTPLEKLPLPWSKLLNDFLKSGVDYLNKYSLEVGGVVRCFSIHKANIASAVLGSKGNQVILVEDMTENKMLEDQLAHSERLASIGQLAAGVAHEIGNPITGIDCLSQELKSLSGDPDVRDTAQQILDQTKRVSSIVHMLLSYAHSGQLMGSEKLQQMPVVIHTCVSEAISLLRLSKKNNNLIFKNKCDHSHQVLAGYQKLQQVFINILGNAADASQEGGVITVSSKETQYTIDIAIEDQGHGIPKEIQDKLRDPFFTTKEVGKGTGLGLAVTWNIIEAYSGTIQVISPADIDIQAGTCFIISLPILGSRT